MISNQSGNTSAPEETLPLVDAGITHVVGPEIGQKRSIPLRALFLIIPVSVMLGGVLGLFFQPPGLRAFFSVTGLQPGAGSDKPIAVAVEQIESGAKVSVESEGDVLALGRLIPRGDVASVSMPFGSSDARIETVEVEVGDTVTRGDVIAVLDNLSQLEASFELAQANVKAAEVSLDRSRALCPPSAPMEQTRLIA